MFTFKTKHFAVLAVALTVMVLGSSALAQTNTQTMTMFLGEGVTKINMIEYKPNPTPAPGQPAGNNPTWEVSPFGKRLETRADGTNNNNLGASSSILRLGTFGKSSLKGQTLSFEIVGGAIDRLNKTGDITHAGGFTITQGGLPGRASTVTANTWQPVAAKRYQVAALRIDLAGGLIDGLIVTSQDWAEQHTGSVVGRNDIFNIKGITVALNDADFGSTNARSSRFDTLFVQNLEVTVNAAFAQDLNTFFGLTGTAQFQADERVGWASVFTVGVPPRELPDYRDWVLKY